MNNNNIKPPNKRVLKIYEFIAHGSNVTACTLGHKSNQLAATGGEDKKVNLWTINKPTCIMSITGHTSSIQSILFSSNEDKIVSGSTSGSVKVWDLECNKLICNLIGHKSSVTCLEYHTYADYIASGSVDSQIRLWDLRRKGCIFTYKGHTNAINGLKFSPDSKWIASVSEDNLTKIWDLKAGRLLIDLKGHQGSVNSLEFHPNEFLLATGSSDRTVKFWDLEKMENVSTSPQSPNAIKVIQFEPTGKCLFSASSDYLQSISWEPSELHDSVYCQWKTVTDMCINSNRLQVAPIGVPPENELYSGSASSSGVSSSYPVTKPSTNLSASSASSTTHRRNFRLNDQIEAPEQSNESNQINSNESDNSQAKIYNQEEYNKIFQPQKEIIRKDESGSNSKNDKSKFFIDIRTNGPPPPQLQVQQPQPQPQVPREPVQIIPPYATDIPITSQAVSSSIPSTSAATAVTQSVAVAPNPVKPTAIKLNSPTKLSINENYIKNEDSSSSSNEKFTANTNMSNNVNNSNNNNNQAPEHNIDLISIEFGHDSFMKTLKLRYKNLQSICVMWNSGNIKSALDHAANLNDVYLMADILNEINPVSNVWNLDICTILLPSIKNVINSKYEEHMLIASESCKIIFKNFGKLIKSNLINASAVGVGVDISREERQSKCKACYSYLLDIINIIEKKLPLINSTKLINNFREINLLMRTIE